MNQKHSRLLSLFALAIFMSIVCASTVMAGGKESAAEKAQKQAQQNAVNAAIINARNGDPNN